MLKKIQAWNDKSVMIADSLAGPKANQAKVQTAIGRRIGDHIECWTRKKAEIEALASDRTNNPQILFERLLTLIRRAGVHAHHIQEPMQDLAGRMREYSSKYRRFRIC
jgi:hypothetical protein